MWPKEAAAVRPLTQPPSFKVVERTRYCLHRLVSPPTQLTSYSTMAPQFPSKKVGVLGATGSVGQRFILLLEQHPHFVLHAVGASSRSAGKKYKDAVRWKQASPMGKVSELVVKECKASEFAECDIVFSGLDSDVAGDVGG